MGYEEFVNLMGDSNPMKPKTDFDKAIARFFFTGGRLSIDSPTKFFYFDSVINEFEVCDTQEKALEYARQAIEDHRDEQWPEELINGTGVVVGIVTHESVVANKVESENKEYDFTCDVIMEQVGE